MKGSKIKYVLHWDEKKKWACPIDKPYLSEKLYLGHFTNYALLQMPMLRRRDL